MKLYLLISLISCGASALSYAMEQRNEIFHYLDTNFKYPDIPSLTLLGQHQNTCLYLLQAVQDNLSEPVQSHKLRQCAGNLSCFHGIYKKTTESKLAWWKNECDAIWKQRKNTLQASILTMLARISSTHQGYYMEIGKELHGRTLEGLPSDNKKSEELNTLLTNAHEIKLYFEEINTSIK